jgi:hypothetical protein
MNSNLITAIIAVVMVSGLIVMIFEIKRRVNKNMDILKKVIKGKRSTTPEPQPLSIHDLDRIYTYLLLSLRQCSSSYEEERIEELIDKIAPFLESDEESE